MKIYFWVHCLALLFYFCFFIIIILFSFYFVTHLVSVKWVKIGRWRFKKRNSISLLFWHPCEILDKNLLSLLGYFKRKSMHELIIIFLYTFFCRYRSVKYKDRTQMHPQIKKSWSVSLWFVLQFCLCLLCIEYISDFISMLL